MSDIHQDDHDGNDEFDPATLFAKHKASGEPLGEDEVEAIVAAGLAARSDFGMRGGNLWWHDATFPNPDGDAEPRTAEQFRDWFTERVAQWCRENGLPPNGEGTDLGDLLREWDDTQAFAGIGVTLVPAHEDQTLFIVGPNASWIATMGIELGIENETILHDPLNNLRVDVPLSELRSYRDRIRRTAEEITSLLEDGGGMT